MKLQLTKIHDSLFIFDLLTDLHDHAASRLVKIKKLPRFSFIAEGIVKPLFLTWFLLFERLEAKNPRHFLA